MTERDTQRQIVELLRRSGWQVCVISQPTAARAQLVGLPDLIAFKHGATLLVEVKSEKGKLKSAQSEFRARVEGHTGPHLRYCLARSVDDVLAALADGPGRPRRAVKLDYLAALSDALTLEVSMCWVIHRLACMSLRGGMHSNSAQMTNWPQKWRLRGVKLRANMVTLSMICWVVKPQHP